MNMNIIKHLSLILLSIILTLVAVLPMQNGKADRSDWMADLEDDASLNSLTIPGTHDSGALHSIADISGKCQTLTIREQLKIGVRFLDIRLQLVDNKLKVVHSFVDQMTDFEDTLSDMVNFIRNNGSEFLIVSIKEDASPKRSDKEFRAVLEDMLVSNILLPLGSLTFLLFATHRFGWGWKAFRDEANAGSGRKFPDALRFYCAYILPVLIVVLIAIGLWRRFG